MIQYMYTASQFQSLSPHFTGVLTSQASNSSRFVLPGSTDFAASVGVQVIRVETCKGRWSFSMDFCSHFCNCDLGHVD